MIQKQQFRRDTYVIVQVQTPVLSTSYGPRFQRFPHDDLNLIHSQASLQLGGEVMRG
jgi:hypothetical protein